MALIKPRELMPGGGRGQQLKGRVCGFIKGTSSKGHDFGSFHLVVEDGLSGVLYIEAWRDHSRRIASVIIDDCIVLISNVAVKVLGDKTQWQCSDLDVYGSVLGPTTFKIVDDDGSFPLTMPLVQLHDLPKYRRIPHLISIAAILVETTVSSSSKATAPALNLVLGAKQQSVRVAVWKDHAANVNSTNFTGEPVAVCCIKVSEGKDDTTELGTTQNTTLTKAPTHLATELRQQTSPKNELTSMSKTFAILDYATMPARPGHLGEIASMLVPNKARDFSGDLYEVFHVLI